MAALTFTALQLITRAGTLAGIFAQGEVPSAADGQDALALLNGLVDGFATQRLALPASQREVFSFVTSQSTYTIGPSGADWVTTRPVSIDAMAVLSLTATPNFEIGMAPLDDQSYTALSIKGLTAPFPTYFYWNATFPNGSIFVYPTPTDAVNYQAVLYTPTQLSTFATLSTSVTMPPGYYRMLYYNLAQELAPAFARELSPVVAGLAAQSLADIKRINVEMLDLGPGAPLPGVGGIYSIYSDQNL